MKIPEFRQQTVDSWDRLFANYPSWSSARFAIHGIPIELSCADSTVLEQLREFFPKSWQSDKEPELRVFWRSPDDSLLLGTPWDAIADHDCLFTGDFVCQRDFLTKKLGPNQYQLIAPLAIDDGIFNFLRFLLPLQLLKQNKVVFHSSCVLDSDQKAYLFFGPSGAGKTTIASLCDSGVVLGDDMNILTPQADKVMVEVAAIGQQVFAQEQLGRQFLVKAAFWLQKSTNLEAQAVTDRELGLVLSSFANIFWDQVSEEQYLSIFSLLAKIKQNLPIYNLEFPKSPEVFEYVQSL